MLMNLISSKTILDGLHFVGDCIRGLSSFLFPAWWAAYKLAKSRKVAKYVLHSYVGSKSCKVIEFCINRKRSLWPFAQQKQCNISVSHMTDEKGETWQWRNYIRSIKRPTAPGRSPSASTFRRLAPSLSSGIDFLYNHRKLHWLSII